MPRLLIEWHEIRQQDLPRRCVACGSRDADFVAREFKISRWGFFRASRQEWITVELPFCWDHADGSPGPEGRLTPSQFTDEGVELMNVCDKFIDALEDHRDGLDKPPPFRGGARARKRRRAEVEEKSFPRRRPERPPTRSGMWGAIVVSILALVGVLAFFCCGGALLLNRPRHPVPAPPFGPAPGAAPNAGPPFGPALPGR